MASLIFPGIASASTSVGAETLVGAFGLAHGDRVGVEASPTLGLHRGCAPTYDQLASDSLLAARGASQVAPRVAKAANHVFGPKSLARHKLGGVLDAFKGDSVAAFNALEGAAQQLANQGAIKGVFQTTVQVAGQTVTVRGAVVEGVVKVGTAFIP